MNADHARRAAHGPKQRPTRCTLPCTLRLSRRWPLRLSMRLSMRWPLRRPNPAPLQSPKHAPTHSQTDSPTLGPPRWLARHCARSLAAWLPHAAVALLAACGGGAADSVTPTPAAPVAAVPAWRVPGTGQTACYSNDAPIACPAADAAFFGQDGQRPGPAPAYTDNGNGTATDRVTGLMWARALAGPMSWDETRTAAGALRTGGYADWRVPSIKELYTLIDFRGWFAPTAAQSRPFIDNGMFEFAYAAGSRFFDVQLWSATPYVATTMNNDATVFGVNFADGRIKGYPRWQPGTGDSVPQRMLVRFVRGGPGGGNDYGRNDYRDNADGGVTDHGSGLTWQQRDDGTARRWRDALAYCAALRLAGQADWRLPDAKELHSIVDYTRAPAATGVPALAPPLQASSAESYYWTGTTVLDGPPEVMYSRAVYIAFGRALGYMEVPPGSGTRTLIDVHGAGSQRADPKDGDPAAYPRGFGPQGDDVRIFNYVRCVRGQR